MENSKNQIPNSKQKSSTSFMLRASSLFRHSSFVIRYSPRGFGLLETVVAIAVITTGLFAVFTLVFANLRASDAARLRFGGVQVAREGVEVVRMIRDANWVTVERGQPQYAELPTTVGDATTRAVAVFDPVLRHWSLVLGVSSMDFPEARVVRVRLEPSDRIFWTQGDTVADPDDNTTFYRRLITLHPICRDPGAAPGSETIILRGTQESCASRTIPRIGTLVSSTATWTDDGRAEETTVEEELYEWR